jgi:hypothetical protein
MRMYDFFVLKYKYCVVLNQLTSFWRKMLSPSSGSKYVGVGIGSVIYAVCKEDGH